MSNIVTRPIFATRADWREQSVYSLLNEASVSGYGKSLHSLSQVSGVKKVEEKTGGIAGRMIKIEPPTRPASPAAAQSAAEYTPLTASEEHKKAFGSVQRELLKKTPQKAPVTVITKPAAPKAEPKSKGILRTETSARKTNRVAINLKKNTHHYVPRRSFYQRWIRPLRNGFLDFLSFFFCHGNNRLI